MKKFQGIYFDKIYKYNSNKDTIYIFYFIKGNTARYYSIEKFPPTNFIRAYCFNIRDPYKEQKFSCEWDISDPLELLEMHNFMKKYVVLAE